MPSLKTLLVSFFRLVGAFTIFTWRVCTHFFDRRSYNWREIFSFMWEISGRIFLILMISAFGTGIGSTLNTSYMMELVGVKHSDIGSLMTAAIATNLVPIMLTTFIAMRVGTSVTAEIGLMRITEQIDALEMMAVNPLQKLVFPKCVAAMVTFPIIIIVGIYFGVLGSFLLSVLGLHVNPMNFQTSMNVLLDISHFWALLVKTILFGMIITLGSSFFGYYARGGSQGVGKAVTQSIVFVLIMVFISNFLVTVVLS